MNVTQQSHPPSVEQCLSMDGMATLQERYGRSSLLKAVRDYLAELGEAYRSNELLPQMLLKECHVLGMHIEDIIELFEGFSDPRELSSLCTCQ